MLKPWLSLEKRVVFFKAVSAEIVCWRKVMEYILWVRKGGAALFLFAHIFIIISFFSWKQITQNWQQQEGVFLVFFLFLYPSRRVAEYLLVNIGGEMHCSKTMQKEKYILKQELELKEN